MAEQKRKSSTKKTASRSKSSGSTRTRSAATERSTRKAPTKSPTPARSGGISSQVKIAAALFVAFCVIGGVSVVIGMSDDGRINVADTISQRASTQEAAGDIEGSQKTREVTAPPQQQDGTPQEDPLIGRGNKVTEQQKREQRQRQAAVEEAATSSATTSDAEATSNEATSTEGGTTTDGSDGENTNATTAAEGT